MGWGGGWGYGCAEGVVVVFDVFVRSWTDVEVGASQVDHRPRGNTLRC